MGWSLNFKHNNLVYSILFPLLSGVIYGLSWNFNALSIFQLVSLVPFFLSIDYIRQLNKSTRVKLGKLIIAIILFRTPIICIVICWMFPISFVAIALLVIVEIFLFSLLSSVILVKNIPLYAIICVLILYEFLMQNVILLVPFYLMGYSWGDHIGFIQYYSFLGVEGGSAILFLVNFAFFRWWKFKKLQLFSKIVFALFIGLTAFSLLKFNLAEPIAKSNTAKMSIIHCHFQSKDSIYRTQPLSLIDSVAHVAAPNSLVILPEVFFNGFGWVNNLSKNRIVQHIDSIEKANNQVYLLGAYLFSTTQHPTPQSRYLEKYKVYYNSNNASVLLDNRVRIKSKKRFIPFFEYVPNNPIAQWINKHIAKIGDDRKVTALNRYDQFSYKGQRFNSLLCYESIYPLMVARHAKENEFIVVQANENWNKSELLSNQYFKTNKANAIQIGLPLYRTSNFGYSAIINPDGTSKYVYKTGKSFTLLEAKLPKKEASSFYCNITGYTYWLSGILLVVFLFNAVFKSFKSSKPTKK